MNVYNYNYFVVEYQKDNSSLNSLYEKIIDKGIESFQSFDEYVKTIKFLIIKFVQYNDYLHSNNLMQVFRLICNKKGINIDQFDWYLYYSILIYSKRSIKYYLDNPFKFWETVYQLSNFEDSKEDYIERLDNLLVDILEFYKREYVKFPEYLYDSLNKFINYYFKNKRYSIPVTKHMNELKDLASTKNAFEVEQKYYRLPSNNIDFEDEKKYILSDLQESNVSFDNDEKNIQLEQDYYGDVSLSEEDFDKKIIIIGSDTFLRKTNVIEALAEEYNVSKRQLEIYNDYDRIKQEAERIINKTKFNDKYIGIILGSMPHSTTGNEGESSLVVKITSEQGFPYSVVCRTNSNNGKLKITKTSFRKALREIIINYKSK